MTVQTPVSRVLLAGLPPLLSGVIERAFEPYADIVVVGTTCELADLDELVAATDANVVVCGSDHVGQVTRSVTAGPLAPDTFVLPVDGGDVTLLVVRPRRSTIGDLATIDLAGAIRRSVGERTVG